MTHALEDHEGIASIGGRTVTNIRFADDIDDIEGEEEELAKLVACLDKASTAYEHRDLCQEDQANDKQHQWHHHRDQIDWTEA